MVFNDDVSKAMSVKLEDVFGEFPKMPEFVEGIRRAPKRKFTLTQAETELALKNALRYFYITTLKKSDIRKSQPRRGGISPLRG